MQTARLLTFGPYRLDPVSGQLWRGKQEVKLTPKSTTLLRYLVERAGQVVTKEELFQAVWPETVVSDAALTTCIQELRSALRDNSKNPRYLKTIHRRGFQFVGSLQSPGLPEPLPVSVPQREMERKLVAILSADVQGYSRLMSEDELATIRTLTAYREAMTVLITQHRGRVVDAPGDNLLAEFASAVDAVEAAVAIQHDLKTRNAELPPQRQMHYRIGINVGDVVVEGGRLYGDGVNIAARLEALAEGGGICLSRSVYEQVKNKVALTYEYVGERTVKNIAEPVAVYRVLLSSSPASSPVPGSKFQVQSSPAPSPQHPAPTLVGRDGELAQLHLWLDKALRGERQVVFVSGEPGIGKTTLVEAFLKSLESRVQRLESEDQLPLLAQAQTLDPRYQTLDTHPWIGRGQCVEHYGAGEAYLPILEALGRLCRGEDGNEVITLLRQQAPTWLVQLPAFLSTTELEELQRRTAGVTRERMLRELAEAAEALTAERALILRVEDLHWSDYSTLDLLSVLARRHEAAKLFIIGTYRPIEVLTRDHPLRAIKQELQVHGQCEELALDFLTEAHVIEYLARRFGSLPSSLPQPAICDPQSPVSLQALAHIIHQRTDGNPLFVVNVVNDLIAQGMMVQTNGGWEVRGEVKELTLGTPVNLRQLIEQQIARVSPDERKVLEAASVAGAEFSAAAVAASVETTVEAVEEHCAELVRREQFLRARGTTEWPDGTIAARYGFVHALYQEVLYERLAVSRRVRLHRQIGEREEQGYGERVREIAAELAVHFEQGRDYARAVQYRQQAGQRASQRGANTEAVSHVTIGLELLKTWPDTPARMQQELALQLTLGALRTATHGFAAPEVAQAYGRARELCEQAGEKEQIFPALVAVAHYHAMRAEHKTARELSERLYAIAQDSQNPDLLIEAHFIQGDTLIWIGEFLEGRAHLEQGIALYDPEKHRAHAYSYGLDPGVLCRLMATQVLWLLGYPDQALTRAQEARDLVQDFPHANSVSIGLASVAYIHAVRREWPSAQKHAEATVAYATEFDLPYLVAQMSIFWGAALAALGHADEGITKMKEGLALQRAIGGRILQQLWLGLQVEAYIDAGRYAEGWAALEEAMTVRPNHGDRYWEAELYRLKGELLLAQARPNSKTPDFQYSPAVKMEVEACYQQALEVARELSARSLELRAATSLARLWQQQGKTKKAHKLLSEIYKWFTEGFETKDLQEAKELLEQLGTPST